MTTSKSHYAPKTIKNDIMPPRSIKAMAEASRFYKEADDLMKNKSTMSDKDILKSMERIREQFRQLAKAGQEAWEYATSHGVGHELARYRAAAETQHKGVDETYIIIMKRMTNGVGLSQAMDDLPLNSFSPAKKEIWQGGDEHKMPNPIYILNEFARRTPGSKIDTYVTALKENFSKIDEGMRKIAPMFAMADEERQRLDVEKMRSFKVTLPAEQKQMLQAVAKVKQEAAEQVKAPKPSLKEMMKQKAQDHQPEAVISTPAKFKSEVEVPRNTAGRNTMTGSYKVSMSL